MIFPAHFIHPITIPIIHMNNKTYTTLNCCENNSKFKKSISGFILTGKGIVFVNGNSTGKIILKQITIASMNNRSARNKR